MLILLPILLCCLPDKTSIFLPAVIFSLLLSIFFFFLTVPSLTFLFFLSPSLMLRQMDLSYCGSRAHDMYVSFILESHQITPSVCEQLTVSNKVSDSGTRQHFHQSNTEHNVGSRGATSESHRNWSVLSKKKKRCHLYKEAACLLFEVVKMIIFARLCLILLANRLFTVM